MSPQGLEPRTPRLKVECSSRLSYEDSCVFQDNPLEKPLLIEKLRVSTDRFELPAPPKRRVTKAIHQLFENIPYRIRTCDPLIKSQVLPPTELRR